MDNPISTLQLNILHVVTLNSSKASAGGPVRVARELCLELNNRNNITEIFSGTIKNFEPDFFGGVKESYVHVKPIFKNFPISSLWSWKIISPLNQRIKKSDIVHIHFARDLVSYTAALLCLFNRKKFVTQTHGMIISDNRLSIKIIDVLFTILIWKRTSVNFVLNTQELSQTLRIYKRLKTEILPNGIAIKPILKPHANKNSLTVIFCARLHLSKGVDKFLALTKSQLGKNSSFEIYGPNGGELDNMLENIHNNNLAENTRYMGVLPPSAVATKLTEIDLVVLPSSYDPFPMVILEALSVGTPVLVMPSCGFAAKLSFFNSDFVAESETTEGLISTYNRLVGTIPDIDKREIINFCAKTFGISKVCSILEKSYKNILLK